VNVVATVAALRSCLDKVIFADCLLLTDCNLTAENGIRVVPIEKLQSARDYSEFVLRRLADHVNTTHCLVVQWDGFILDAGCWDPRFLEFDYIGAPWPQFDDAHFVGNGGFSLRSRKLLVACQSAEFRVSHPEDLAIGRVNRAYLEAHYDIRFADRAIAERFSFERSASERPTFGFHGIFNMMPVLGTEKFWKIYRTLDHAGTPWADFRILMHQLGKGPLALRRRARVTLDRIIDLFAR
jgi:hypothetical protein